MIGRPVRRLEDPRLITGRGRYLDDLSAEGAHHAVFVRSIEAHAVIRSVSFDPAQSGARLYTASDLGLEAPMPVQYPSPLIARPVVSPPLAGDEVCYVGQPIAVLVAATPAEAADALAAVTVDYESLAVTIDHRRALAPGAPAVHLGSPSNLVATVRAGYGDAGAVLAASPRVVTFDVDQHRGAAASLEGRGVLARWDHDEERVTMWTSSQSPHAVRANVAAYLGMSVDELRVITPDVGGGFGPKAVVHAEEYVLAALARHLRVPVKWVERRREHFSATTQQRGQSGRVEAAFDPDGRIRALRARLTHDCGAFVPYGVVVPATTARLMSGPYVVPDLDVEIACVYTNATPTGAIRGAGRPCATFILERVMDAIAAEVGVDRAEVRRRNLIPADAFPYRLDLTGSDGRPVTYDGGDYRRALEAALEAADVAGFEERKARSRETGRLRGYGLAVYVEDTGLGPYEGARVEVLTDGTVLVETGSSSQGQGHATVFAQICAAQLGVDPARVRIRSGDTTRYPHGVSTVASRTAQTGASAVHVAAAAVAEAARRLSADLLEAAVEDIVLADGVAMVVGQPGSGIALGDLAAAAQPRSGGRLPSGQETPGLSAERVLPFGGSAFTYGSHVAEVEVDPETGHVAVTGYVVVHDCGTVLNPMIVDGQIDGGVVHGLGNALSEAVRYSDDGQPLTTTFMDYRLPTAGEVPPLVKVHMETPSPTNPLGVKGAGEGGTIPAAAAVVSAVEHALSGSGVRVDHYPVTAEWVVGALSAAGPPTER